MPGLAGSPLDRRALDLALTRIANITASEAVAENGDPLAAQARRIGVTGAPTVA
jgi:hypothetical protein